MTFSCLDGQKPAVICLLANRERTSKEHVRCLPLSKRWTHMTLTETCQKLVNTAQLSFCSTCNLYLHSWYISYHVKKGDLLRQNLSDCWSTSLSYYLVISCETVNFHLWTSSSIEKICEWLSFPFLPIHVFIVTSDRRNEVHKKKTNACLHLNKADEHMKSESTSSEILNKRSEPQQLNSMKSYRVLVV